MVQSHIVALTLIVAILPSNLKLVHIIYILYCRFESEECVAAARTRESSRRFGWDGLDLNPGFIKLTSRWSQVMMMMTIAKMTMMTMTMISIRLSTLCETLVLSSTLCRSGQFTLLPLTFMGVALLLTSSIRVIIVKSVWRRSFFDILHNRGWCLVEGFW